MNLSPRDRGTVFEALRAAIELEDSVIDAHMDYGRERPMRGYAYVVRRAARRIRRYRTLIKRINKENARADQTC